MNTTSQQLPPVLLFTSNGSRIIAGVYEPDSDATTLFCVGCRNAQLLSRVQIPHYVLSIATSCIEADQTIAILIATVDRRVEGVVGVWPSEARVLRWENKHLEVLTSLTRDDLCEIGSAGVYNGEYAVVGKCQWRLRYRCKDGGWEIRYYWGLLPAAEGSEPLFLCDAHVRGRLCVIPNDPTTLLCDLPSATYASSAFAAIRLGNNEVVPLANDVVPRAWAAAPDGERAALCVHGRGTSEIVECDLNAGETRRVTVVQKEQDIVGFIEDNIILAKPSGVSDHAELIAIDMRDGHAESRHSLPASAAVATNGRGTYAILADRELQWFGTTSGKLSLR
jgi:hypothetical protein